ncbi:MAG: glycolate oxidase subunit GlcE [Pseudomonadota bacterium]
MDPVLKHMIDCVQSAHGAGARICIRGGGTKEFYGEPAQGTVLDTRGLHGISSHEPSELVVSVRTGTLLADLETALAEHGQYLPFEPPRFASGGTVGGMVAAGLSGPARASVGSVRDYVLGATLLNGQGEVLSFGGQVIKNVAGYDVSRLLAGSLGTLGLLLEVSLKVLPLPPATTTLRFAMNAAGALQQLNAWAGQPLPLNASAWHQGRLTVRLSGAVAAVQTAARQMAAAQGGEVVDPKVAQAFWSGLRDHTDPFFDTRGEALPLWRLSVPATTAPITLPDNPGSADSTLMEWGGAQRWLRTAASAEVVRQCAAQVGGHATLFRAGAGARAAVFAPLSAPLARIHQALKLSFDPHGLFNPGRMYPSSVIPA